MGKMTNAFDKVPEKHEEKEEEVVTLNSDYVFDEIQHNKRDEDGVLFIFSSEYGITYFVTIDEENPKEIWIEIIRSEAIENNEEADFIPLRLIKAPEDWENGFQVRRLAEYICGFLDSHIYVTRAASELFGIIGARF